MAAIYEYTGVVEKILPMQTFSSGFTKRDVVMTDDLDHHKEMVFLSLPLWQILWFQSIL